MDLRSWIKDINKVEEQDETSGNSIWSRIAVFGFGIILVSTLLVLIYAIVQSK
jgi:hypothetical protein